MSIDQQAQKILDQVKEKLDTLTEKQSLLFGYVTAMRQLPAYISFGCQNPEFGNARMAEAINKSLYEFVLNQKELSNLEETVSLFDKNWVPDMDDFGSESAALEGALALIFLYEYSKTYESKYIFEIFRGVIECILMSSDNISDVNRYLSSEQRIMHLQYELIKSYENVTEELVERCLHVNEGSDYKGA